MAAPSPLFATLHQLVDAARFHSEQQAIDAHDSIDAHVAGKSLEDYRKAKEAAAPANVANEDAILEKAKQIQAQRDANAEQQTQIAASAQAQRPAAPVAADTPASPSAESEL